MNIKLAVFDMAGTTIADDNAVATAFTSAFGKNGIKISDEDVRPLMGYRKTLAIEMVLKKYQVSYDENLINRIHDQFIREMVDYYANSPEVRAFPDSESVFRELKQRNIRIALNTGFPKVIADTIMGRLGWKSRDLVDDYIASDEVEKGRPEPYMIRELMLRSGITDPKEVIKIGDTETDIREGKNAGCALSLAVTTGAFTREELEPYAPDHILNKLTELIPLID